VNIRKRTNDNKINVQDKTHNKKNKEKEQPKIKDEKGIYEYSCLRTIV